MNAELTNTCENVKMNPFGLSEHMVYVFTFQSLVFDHRLSVQSVSSRVFWPKSKARDHSWLERSGKESWHLLSRLVIWFLRTCGWVVWSCFEMKKLRLSCSSDVRLMRGTELQPAASRLSIWFTHRLSSGPGSCDLLCKGLGLPEYLPGALPVVTGAPDPLASLEELWTLWDDTGAEFLGVYIWNVGVVFFFVCLFVFYCENNLRLNSEGCLD